MSANLRLLLVALGLLLSTVTCVGPREGAVDGECDDGADNDGDGTYDCDDEDCATLTPCPGATFQPGMLDDAISCDAGDEAFVRRLLPQLWGRQARSIREIDLLVQIIEQSDRLTLVQAMMDSDEFSIRWLDVVKDMLQVNRVGDRSGVGCTSSDPFVLGDPRAWVGRPDLASFVRDNPPDGPQHSDPWTLNDLILSALALDDLSPVFRAQLFAQLGSKLINLDNPGAEPAWRVSHANIFESTYLNRRMSCLQCHNSEFSATDDSDPELDQTWQVPGYFERALYGGSAGRPVQDLAAFFRVEGVLAMEFYPEGVYRPGLHWGHGDGFNPWGMHSRCGEFILPDDIEADPQEWSGYFVSAVDDRPSIWHLESLLHSAFEELRADGLEVGDDLDVDGEQALAWMVGMTISERVWTEVTGRRLTAPHFFPKNRYQRDLLTHLTSAFVDDGYSLRSLIETIALHPYFNPGQPSQCEALDSAYYMAPVFDPWVTDHEVPEYRLNTPGDSVSRLPARVLMDSAIFALGWPDFDRNVEAIWVNPALDPGHEHDDGGAPVDENGNPLEEGTPINEDGFPLTPTYAFELGIGMFMLDSATGFRSNNLSESLTWEEALGSCVDPFPEEVTEEEPEEDAPAPDWIDGLLAEAPGELTLGDMLLTLKDRLTARPTFDSDTERELLEALVGQGLDTPMDAIGDQGAALRRACGAFLSSPDFQLAGAPGAGLIGTAVPFVPSNSSSVELCEEMQTQMFAGIGVSCDANGRIVLND